MDQATLENAAKKEPKSGTISTQGEDRIYLAASEDICLAFVEEW